MAGEEHHLIFSDAACEWNHRSDRYIDFRVRVSEPTFLKIRYLKRISSSQQRLVVLALHERQSPRVCPTHDMLVCDQKWVFTFSRLVGKHESRPYTRSCCPFGFDSDGRE